ncbi:hypothetical protein DEU56DRAFT_962153 [Suillus clintonianus]|uniref:uncharacterized protein n=1 Tax=Suillus clintonianus TaxID=1904413 RepID=UPI001B886AF3|nr:uncharacterized protein DEU56DRAFT_962153 [Suillus clintonianus]KAG2125338.1 hypothetical protein DEU56DRAFT_962153 [Suillus clintonianus]
MLLEYFGGRQFGGQGFSKSARGTFLRRSYDHVLLHRLSLAGIDAETSYLDALIESEPKHQGAPVMQPLNTVIQSSVIGFLQTIGDIEMLAIEILEPAVIGKLFLYIGWTCKTSCCGPFTPSYLPQLSYAYNGNPPPEDRSAEGSQESAKRTYTINSLLAQTIIDGIAVPRNRPVMQHWLDFVLMQFQPALQSVISPIADCLSRHLRLLLLHALKANQPMANEKYPRVATDAEFVILNALERLLVLGLTHLTQSDVNSQEDDTPVQEKSGAESGVWVDMVWHDTIGLRPEAYSLSLIYNGLILVVEEPWSTYSALTQQKCWSLSLNAGIMPAKGVFGLVDVLIANAQSAVHMICDSITVRIRTPRNAVGDLQMQIYPKSSYSNSWNNICNALKDPWLFKYEDRFMQLAKDLASGRDFKTQVFLALKWLCVLGDKVTQTTAIDDKRIRKNLQVRDF